MGKYRRKGERGGTFDKRQRVGKDTCSFEELAMTILMMSSVLVAKIRSFSNLEAWLYDHEVYFPS